MFVPQYQATLTPTQFASFMCNKPTTEQVVLLGRCDGSVFVIADKALPDWVIQHCSSIPPAVVPDDYTVQDFTTFLAATTEFYKWAYYADEEDLQSQQLQHALQMIPNDQICQKTLAATNITTGLPA